MWTECTAVAKERLEFSAKRGSELGLFVDVGCRRQEAYLPQRLSAAAACGCGAPGPVLLPASRRLQSVDEGLFISDRSLCACPL